MAVFRHTMALFASASLAMVLCSTWSSVQSLQPPPQPVHSSNLVPNTTLSVEVPAAGRSQGQCTDEYFHPRDAQLSAAGMFQTKKNMAGYTGFRVQFEKLTSLDAGHSFKIIEIENGGIQYTPLVKAPQDWKTLVLGSVDLRTRSSEAWKNWYYWQGKPPECNEHLQGSAVFFRGFSFGRFVYGAANHDIFPPLVWLADAFPNATLLVESNPDASYGEGLKTFGKIKDFLNWFDPELFERAKFIDRGYTVCAQSLKVLVPIPAMGHPEMLRSWELFRHMRQHMFRTHPQLPVKSVVYLVREHKDSGHGRWLVQEDADKVLEIAKDALKAHSRPESLVIFNGTWNGKKATFEQQYRIFNSAAVAFGPHGTGFSNVIWMPCTGRPAAVEFICSEQSFNVRGCTHEGNPNLIRYATYWGMHGGSTWLRYYHVFVKDAGDNMTNYMKVDLDGFQMAMDSALGGLPRPGTL